MTNHNSNAGAQPIVGAHNGPNVTLSLFEAPDLIITAVNILSRPTTRQGKSFKKCCCGLMAKSNRQKECLECGPETAWAPRVRRLDGSRRTPARRRRNLTAIQAQNRRARRIALIRTPALFV